MINYIQADDSSRIWLPDDSGCLPILKRATGIDQTVKIFPATDWDKNDILEIANDATTVLDFQVIHLKKLGPAAAVVWMNKKRDLFLGKVRRQLDSWYLAVMHFEEATQRKYILL